MSKVRPLYIIGAGGFGREVAWLIERINADTLTWDFKGFIDDDSILWNTTVGGYQVHGGHEYLEKQTTDLWIVMAIGNSKVRRTAIERLIPFNHIHYATLIDPSVKNSDRVAIGEGSIICAGTIITTDVVIGSHCIINLNCVIGHDAILGSFATLYPSVNASGAVSIGETTEVGTGSAIIQGIAIGANSIIGANSTVVRDIEDDVTAVGSPAKVIKIHA